MALGGSEDRQELREYTEKAYLDYSMYVINDRALPFIGDGLKPVQRRIVYTMSNLGISHQAKYSKAARTIGDTIAKYHPHGEQACYESMVHMAQDFNFRYPLIDGQGHWGAPDDPKSFAAMRYTESRLSTYAQLLLREVNQGTVDYEANYDDTIEEPQYLPALAPILLLNGSTGIAVGMATDVLPHNINEVLDACIFLLGKKRVHRDKLRDLIPGPDLPTGGQIVSSPEEISQVYETGRGTIRCRARYTVEDGEIVVYELPYQASPSKILAEIAKQMSSKKLPMLQDLRDESDYEHPTRLVLVPRSNRVDSQRLMEHLFATTDLEKSLKFNLNVIGLDRKPRVKSLETTLREWLDFRVECVKRRLQYRIDRIERRLHILAALFVVYANLDEVIRVIRESDDPKNALTQRFELTDEQATAILDIRLRQLALMQEIELKKERNQLQTELDDLQSKLDSEKKLFDLIRNEFRALKREFGDERRTIINATPEAQAFTEAETQTNEAITIVLSAKGWVRAARGHDIVTKDLPFREGDEFLLEFKTRSNATVCFFDSTGRTYTTKVSDLPTARGQGEPLTGRFETPQRTKFVGTCTNTPGKVLLATSEGIGFVAPREKVSSSLKKGKSVVNVSPSADLLPPFPTDNQTHYACISSEGCLLCAPLSELPVRASGKGVRLMGRRTKQETLIHIIAFSLGDSLVVHAGKRTFTIRPRGIERFLGKRTNRGTQLPRGFQSVDLLNTTPKNAQSGQ